MKATRLTAVIFHRFGPYHQSRLQACAERFPVLAIEEAAQTSEYAWDEVDRASGGFERLTLLRHGETASRYPANEVARRVYATLQEHRPQTVVIPGWSDPAALGALVWACEQHVPVVIMSESTEFDEPRTAWKEWIKHRVVRLCAAGLVGGTPHRRYLEKLGLPGDQVFTGYDAVDNAHFANGAAAARRNAEVERERLGLPARFFLASCRFVEQKNLPLLLEAFARYRKTAPPEAWDLVLLGDGPLRDSLTRSIQALGLPENVRLPGFKQYGELPAYYGLAAAFVHASNREPWGLVVNEAMAAGLPVIVSERCGCAADLVKPGLNGETFPPDEAEALARHMQQMATASPETLAAMGAASRQIIAEWSPARFAGNLQAAAESAATRTPRPASLLDRMLLKALIWRANGQARRLLPSKS